MNILNVNLNDKLGKWDLKSDELLRLIDKIDLEE